MSELRYVLMDPSKNITILVETSIDINRQNEVARKLMKLEKTAEQLAFIMSFKEKEIIVRMAGGEFCGNAAMSLVSLYAIENELDSHETKVLFYGNNQDIKSELKVSVKKINDNNYEALAYMPVPQKIDSISLTSFKELPIVSLDGISHIIIDEDIEKRFAEKSIKDWCDRLDLEALGFMFYKKIDENNYELRPLVYVRDIDSLFWENACASGSFALGTYLIQKKNNLQDVYIRQAGGDILKVKKEDDDFCLIGQVKLLSKKTIDVDIV